MGGGRKGIHPQSQPLASLFRVLQTKFKELFAKKHPELAQTANPEEVDTFVKNSHHLRVLRGKQWGAFDQDREALGKP